MGPEVKAPTETDRTGLIVPLELTTISTRPRDTVAVTYFGTEWCCHHEWAWTPPNTASPTSTLTIRSRFGIQRMAALAQRIIGAGAGDSPQERIRLQVRQY